MITQLPQTITERDLKRILRDVCSVQKSTISNYGNKEYSPLQYLEIARHPDGRMKGHAFVIFETHKLAAQAVDALNFYEYQGRRLHARFAKEGVEPIPVTNGAGYSYDSMVDVLNSSRRELKIIMVDENMATSAQAEAGSKNLPGSAKVDERESERKERSSHSTERGRKVKPRRESKVVNSDTPKKQHTPLVVNGSSSRRLKAVE